jgi:hypothetical protein
VSNDHPERAGEHENVTFTRTDWLLAPTSTAFGLTKATPRIKPKREGVKAILVETEVFAALKAKTRDLADITPKIDVAEVINAALLLAAEDEATWACVIARLVDRRAEQLAQWRERLAAMATTPRAEPQSLPAPMSD